MKWTPQQTSPNGIFQFSNGLWLPNTLHVHQQPPATSTSPSVPAVTNLPPVPLPIQSSSTKIKKPWTKKKLAGKTLWNWMSLLLVPLLIGIGTIWVTNRQTDTQNALSQNQHQSDQDIAQQARFDDLLKEYRDGIDQLLLSNGLRTSQFNSDVQRIAHARTLDVLRQIDIKRKGIVINYLINLQLVQGASIDEQEMHLFTPIVSLAGADLSGAQLSGVSIDGAYLWDAKLDGAYLIGAELFGAELFGAHFSRAHLNNADFWGSNLSGADLSGADLSGANLTGANLTGADLSGTLMPDGTKHSCQAGEEKYCTQ